MLIEKSFNLAPRHKKFDRKIVKKLRQQSKASINSISTTESRKIYGWNSQVAGCYQRSRAFIRLKISKHSIVYGKVQPEHYVEDLIANWFLSRFPMFTIMIESSRGTFVISKDEKLAIYKDKIDELLPKFEKLLPENDLLKGLEDFNDDEYWEKYYDSQFIKERKNKRYFLKNIPKKFHDWQGLKLEKNRFEKNRNLSDF
ncbi:MAG: DUF4130 domain-containing protein [Nanoarchaeota archaeon]|nr:DUF4130 domain-containing protein [Nanoarchaeota archaeon]